MIGNQNHVINVEDGSQSSRAQVSSCVSQPTNATVQAAKKQRLNGPLIDITNVTPQNQHHISGKNPTTKKRDHFEVGKLSVFVFHVIGLCTGSTNHQQHINGEAHNISSTSSISKVHNEHPFLRKHPTKEKGVYLLWLVQVFISL